MSGKGPDPKKSPPESQHRIATGLVNRDAHGIDDLADGLRVGPYIVFRELVQAQGARMLEGHDVSGQRVLLQLAQLRAAHDDTERAARQDYIRMIAAATEHLSSDPETVVHAHGAVEGPEGTRTLFWAIPWVDGSEALGRANVPSAADLLMAARSLMDRLATRHLRGRLDPLLSEQLIIIRDTGGVSVVGVPIHLPIDWLSNHTTPARLALEEREAAEPAISGDIWRAGVALRALAATVGDIPDNLAALIESLTNDDVAERPASANDVLVELESMDGTLAASRDPIASPVTVEAEAPPDLEASTRLSGDLSGPSAAETIGEEHGLTRSQLVAAQRAAEEAEAKAEAQAQEKDTDTHKKAERHVSSEALTIQPTAAKQGTASERATKPPGIWTRAKEAQTVRLPYPKPDDDDAGSSSPAEGGMKFPRLPKAMSIPEATTLLDARSPKAPIPKARMSDSDPETKPAPQAPPSMFTQTLVDEPMPDFTAAVADIVARDSGDDDASATGAVAKDPSSELTLRDVSRADLEAQEKAQLEQSESTTVDEGVHRRDAAPPTKRTVWDESRGGSVNPAAAAAAAAVHPQGPAGTLVAPLGPRGTIVGVRLIDDPTGLRPLDGTPQLPPPRLLPPGGTLPPGARFPLPQAHVGMLPAGPLSRGSSPDADVIPKGATVAGQPALIGTPEALALRARAIRPAASDTGLVPPGGWPAPQPVPVQPGHALAPPPGSADLPARIEQGGPPQSASAPDAVPSWAPPVENDDTPPQSSMAGKWMLLGAIAFFATGGAVALAASYFLPKSVSPTANLGRGPGGIPAQVKPYAIGPAAEVVLEAKPAEASVVAERTGRVLGKTPLRFLVPPGMRIAVLIAAPNHEPQRLILPERGRISTELVPLAASEHCRVAINAPQGVGLEGFGGEIETGTRFRIPGAVVLRSDGHGAWLVRCPKFGGQGQQDLDAFPPPREVKLDVSGPWGSEIILSGTSEGKVPVSTTRPIDFYEVVAQDDVGKSTRWLPLIGDTTLKMPKPRKRAVKAEPAPPEKPDEEEPTKRRRRRRRRR